MKTHLETPEHVQRNLLHLLGEADQLERVMRRLAKTAPPEHVPFLQTAEQHGDQWAKQLVDAFSPDFVCELQQTLRAIAVETASRFDGRLSWSPRWRTYSYELEKMRDRAASLADLYTSDRALFCAGVQVIADDDDAHRSRYGSLSGNASVQFEDAEEDDDPEVIKRSESLIARLRPFVSNVYCLYARERPKMVAYNLIIADNATLVDLNYDAQVLFGCHPSKAIRVGDGVVFAGGRFGAFVEDAYKDASEHELVCRIILSSMSDEQQRAYWVYHFGCADCETHIYDGGWYGYEVHDGLWEQATAYKPANLLCIPCLERRIHRRLQPADFNPHAPLNRTDADTHNLIEERRQSHQLT